MAASFEKLKRIMSTILLAISLSLSPAIAMADDIDNSLNAEIEKIQDKIQVGIINNLVTIAALAGFVICAVSAAGGNVGQIAIQNMGYVVFLVFGSTLILKFIAFAQA